MHANWRGDVHMEGDLFSTPLLDCRKSDLNRALEGIVRSPLPIARVEFPRMFLPSESLNLDFSHNGLLDPLECRAAA